MAYTKTCTECCGPFKAKNYDAEFCGPKCRMNFHNRRRDRGAILYDMTMRNDSREAIHAQLDEWATEDEILGRTRTWVLKG